MAYPFERAEGLTQEQSDILRELNSFHLFSQTDLWKNLCEKMQSMVEEAQEALLGCHPALGAEKRGILSIRWQQREAMRRGIIEYVTSQLNAREQMLEEIKEQNEHNSDPRSNN